nr:MAG TPA: lysis regulatory protein [Caudoviricetes sp.]
MSLVSRFLEFRSQFHIGHVILGFALAFAGLSASLHFSRATLRADLVHAQIELAKVAGQLKSAEDVIGAQGKAIENLQLSIQRHDEINRSLLSRYRNIDARDSEFREKLQQLERNNHDVQNFLDLPLPDALRGLLNDTNPGGVQGDPSTKTPVSNP